jgi:hypothetical protein
MFDHESDVPVSHVSRFSVVGFLLREWPYVAMLSFALFGVAYTSMSRQQMTTYWIALAPFFGLICVIARWGDIHGTKAHWQLIQSQALHWFAVVLAMYLVFVSDVKQIMNSDASALVVLTILALGTFTAGVHVAAWRICLVGVVLGCGVPAIAWLEESTLLLVLLAMVLIAIAVLFYLHDPRGPKKDSEATPY